MTEKPYHGTAGARLPAAQVDDWLGEVSDDDWDDDAAEHLPWRPEGGRGEVVVPAIHDPFGEPTDDRPRPTHPVDHEEARRAAVHRRRLVAVIVLAAALVVAAGIAVISLRGGDSASTSTVAEPVATTPEPTETGAASTSTTTTPTTTTPTTTTPTTTTPTTTTPTETPTTTSPSGQETTPTTTGTASFTLPEGTKLRLGEDADAAVVEDLQQALQAAGYDPGSIDGTYGPKTVAAVLAFQKARGLTADGVVGAATAAALNNAPAANAGAATFDLPEGTKLRLGEDADAAVVEDLQQALQAAGYDPGSIDGTYGPKTVAAVVAFQKENGLTADGVVGAATAAALNDAAPSG